MLVFAPQGARKVPTMPLTHSQALRDGARNAYNGHTVGDAIPDAAELIEGLLACGCLDAEPTAEWLAAYADAWQETARAMNAAAPAATFED